MNILKKETIDALIVKERFGIKASYLSFGYEKEYFAKIHTKNQGYLLVDRGVFGYQKLK